MFQSDLLAYKSMPDVGSSSSTNLLPPQSAIETESFLRLPPDSDPAFLFLSGVKPTSLISLAISPYFFSGSPPLKS
jgi:hypothetical protein